MVACFLETKHIIGTKLKIAIVMFEEPYLANRMPYELFFFYANWTYAQFRRLHSKTYRPSKVVCSNPGSHHRVIQNICAEFKFVTCSVKENMAGYLHTSRKQLVMCEIPNSH